MSTYGYERLEGFTREGIEARLHDMLDRKDADGNPDAVTVADLRRVIDALVEAMTALDSWVLRNG